MVKMGQSVYKGPLLILLIHIIPEFQAGKRYGNPGRSGYALSCLSVNCQAKWDPNCCSGSQQGIGRSIQPLANWRFGSIFRNSIPPVRPYNPPTFEDIFETDHKSEKQANPKVKPHRFSLNLDNKFGMQSNQQQNVFKFSNKFDSLSEMDRNSDSSDTPNEYFKTLNKLKEKQQQMLFGNIYETSTKPYRKQTTTTKHFNQVKLMKSREKDREITTDRYSMLKATSEEELRQELIAKKREEDLLEKQRLKSEYIKAQQAKSKLKKLNAYTQNESEKPNDTYQMHKHQMKVNKIERDFKGENYQTSFNIAKRKKVKKQSADELLKSKQQIAYEEKLARWQQKKAELSKVTKHKFIDKSHETVVKGERVDEIIATTPVPVTYATTTTGKNRRISEEDIILTEVLNQEEEKNEIENYVNKEETYKEKENQDTPFTEELCERLRVPCRFVTEHPCCRLPQRIELVGRARAMDGSADLRWRFLESRPSEVVSNHYVRQDDNGGPRDGPQGRMITGFGGQSGYKRPSSFSIKETKNNIRYNHSVSKGGVLVPRYHYDGGPQLTKTILQHCWRLNYLDCRLESDHPCCALKNNHPIDSLSSNVLDKWLRRQ